MSDPNSKEQLEAKSAPEEEYSRNDFIAPLPLDQQIRAARDEVGKKLNHRTHAREKNKIFPHRHHFDFSRSSQEKQNKRQWGFDKKATRQQIFDSARSLPDSNDASS